MTIKVPDVAEVTLLNFIRTQIGGTPKLRLFKNDIVPGDSDTISTYAEATFPGYLALTTGTWNTVTSVGGVAQFTCPTLTFVRGSGGSGDQIYGYYLTDAAGTTLYWAERDPNAPINMTVAGNSYAVSLLFQLLSQY